MSPKRNVPGVPLNEVGVEIANSHACLEKGRSLGQVAPSWPCSWASSLSPKSRLTVVAGVNDDPLGEAAAILASMGDSSVQPREFRR